VKTPTKKITNAAMAEMMIAKTKSSLIMRGVINSVNERPNKLVKNPLTSI
jgi:hypothetical protein